MRYLIILLLFFSSIVYCQTSPNATVFTKIGATCFSVGVASTPKCQSGEINLSITASSGSTNWFSCRASYNGYSHVGYESNGQTCRYGTCPAGLVPNNYNKCDCPGDGEIYDSTRGVCVVPPNCVAPEVLSWTTDGPICVNEGNSASSSSQSSCAANQAYYDGLCRDVVSSPSQCGSTYTEAIDTGSGYACSNNGGCPSDYSASVYTDQSGSWNVCSPSSGSGNSSDSGNQQSSVSNSTSGGDSSSGSGSGDGSGSGGDGGFSGSSSSAASDSSGSGTGGGSASSAGGGSASSAGNGSASSGAGNAASSIGAGDCDPTSKNYLDCLTSDIPQDAGHDIADHSMDGAQQKTGDGFNNYMGELQGQIDGVVNGGSGVGDGGVSGAGDSLMGYLPSPGSCQPIILSYHGWSSSIDCYYIDIWKLWLGWFLNVVVALHLYNLARKPVEI